MQTFETVGGKRFDDVHYTESKERDDCAFPCHRIQEQRDQHADDLVNHDVTGVGAAEMTFGDIACPAAERKQDDDRCSLRGDAMRQEPPDEKSDSRSERAGSQGNVSHTASGGEGEGKRCSCGPRIAVIEWHDLSHESPIPQSPVADC